MSNLILPCAFTIASTCGPTQTEVADLQSLRNDDLEGVGARMSSVVIMAFPVRGWGATRRREEWRVAPAAALDLTRR